MSATSLVFNVTDTVTGDVSDISAISIVMVTADGTGSKIQYITNGAVPGQLTVTETPLAISTASKYLIALTDTTTSGVFYINVDRVKDVISNGSAASVYFDAGLSEYRILAVNESRSAIRTAIAAVISSGSNPVNPGLTAGTTQTQAGATALSYGFNEVTTVTTAGDGVRLPVAIIGGTVTVLNDGANTMQVYPPTSGTINDGSANASINQAPGVELTFVNIDGTNWESSTQTIELGNGTAALPSLTFASDTDTGIYRIGANNAGFAANGAKVLDISTTGLGVTGALTTTTTAAVGTALTVGTDVTLAKEVNHNISVDTTTTVATAGGNIAVTGGIGATSGNGGNATVTGGVGGATAGSTGGNASLTSGISGVGTGPSGTATLASGAGTVSGVVTVSSGNGTTNSGNINITPGTSGSATVASAIVLANGVVRTPFSTSVATGGTVTGPQLLKGLITVTGATGNVQLPTAAQITTALGATPTGSSIEFFVNAAGMTGTNVATLLVGSNMTVMSAPAITGGGSLAITQDTQVVGKFILIYDSATTCKISRIA